MNSKYRKLSILFALFSILSCQNDIIFQAKQPINSPYWQYQDSIGFEFPVQDTDLLYDLYLQIDHTTEYPFQNLYTYITTTYPSGKTLKQQLNIDLADKTGQWYAKCNGTTCHLKVALQQNAFFEEKGTHRIVLVQHTRQDSLSGLSQIGFELKKVGNKIATK